MSLSTLNSPPLVATAGIGLGYALPFVQKVIMKSPWSTVRIANLVSYGINFLAVSRPGRMDGEAVEDGQLSPRNGKTLVAPAGWAFAIWGPIFLGEAIGIASQFLISSNDNDPIVQILKQSSGPFIVAQLFQSLWCAAFRPKYNQGYKSWISVGMLSATAYSLSISHAAFTNMSTKALNSYSPIQYGVFFLPIALHFGWTTAASIVNLNGAIAMKKDVNAKVVAFVGHSSVIAATVLGIVIAKMRNAPVYSGVIAWALFAVADSMKKRVEGVTTSSSSSSSGSASKSKSKKSFIKIDPNQVGIYGASTQYILSKTGAILNAGATTLIAGLLLFNNDSKAVPTP
jgi:hypothetical protein